MSMALTKPQQETRNTIVRMAKALEKDIANALPKHITPERFLRVFQTAISSTPALLKCEPTSVIGGMVMASQLGIELNTPLGHGWLIPYGAEAKLILGYRGMIDLAMRSGRVKAVYAYSVYAADRFRYQLGSDPKIIHVPAEGERGEYRGSYAVAVLKDGGSQFLYMTAAEVEKVKNSSPSAKRSDSPWKTHPEEMRNKTPLRRLFKFMPVSVEIQRAVAYDEMMESGMRFDVLQAAGVEREVIEAPKSLDDLAGGAGPAEDAEFSQVESSDDFTDEVNRYAEQDGQR